MKDKINIAELLKDCPQGMELYSTIYGTVYFEGVRDTGYATLIDVTTLDNTKLHFYPDGKFNTYYSDSEMTLFPSKDVRTWEGFHRPFVDGDILATDLGSVFYLNTRLNTDEYYGCYAGIGGDGSFHICGPFAYKECCGFATEEEKEKLFQAIKDNGYKWNPEAKALEKLVEPKFKVGDRIEFKYHERSPELVVEVKDNGYILSSGRTLMFQDENAWELYTGKFDITTLKPFDKVLTRGTVHDVWGIDFFGYYKDGYFQCSGHCAFRYCIPYGGNENLLNTTNDCDEYFKIWE